MPTPILSFSNKTITHVACGGEHTIFVEAASIIYASGKADKGQLGIGDNLTRFVPNKLQTTPLQNEKVSALACGYAHRYFTFSLNNFTKCSLDRTR